MKIKKLDFETDFPIDFFILLNTCPQQFNMRQDWGKKIAESYNLDFRYGFTRGLLYLMIL